jgi:hypothetical protein
VAQANALNAANINHNLIVGTGTAYTALGSATDGQLPIGSTGANPVLATLTAGTGILITNGPGSITVASDTAGDVLSLTGNTGGAISPVAGNINTVGTGSITIAGSGNTLTTQLTGLTNHNVQIGAGTATLTQVAPSATSGVPLVSNGSSADPSFSTALIAGGGTASTSFNINGTVISGATTTSPLTSLTMTDGQVIIGSTGNAPAAATLTAGTGVTIQNASNSITISVSGTGLTWNDVTSGTQTLAVSNGYVTNNAGGVTYTLPATASLGDTIQIVGKSGAWSVAQNANQQICLGNAATTVGVTGSIASTNAGDCVELTCITSGTSTVYRVTACMGNITIA